MQELLRKLRFLLHRDRFERELDEEMRHHLVMKAEERGSAEAANRQFGSVTLLKEESRAMWTWTFWEQTTQDLRYGLRTMAGNPLFTAMAVLSLALGIGANSAIYSFMDAILMRTLPVQHPEELVVVNWRAKDHPAVIHGMNGVNHQGKTGITSPNYPFAAYEALRVNQDVFSTLFAYTRGWQLNVVAQGQAEIADAEMVSGGFFSGLGVPPAAGRLIVDDDDRTGSSPVVVISYKYWERRFASKASAVGQSLLINKIPFAIAGVAAPGFFGVDPAVEPQIFVPLHATPLFVLLPTDEQKRRFLDKNFYWVEMMGRLRPGVSIEQAQAALAPQFNSFVAETTSTPMEKVNLPSLWLEQGGSGVDSLRRQYSEPLYVLIAMTGLILAIACANIANLLLARAAARKREMAVRLSLGAGRLRVMRQLLTESLLLSLTGGLLGLIVAVLGIRWLTWLLGNGRENFTLHASLNWQAVGFTVALALITGILFGLAPAIEATKVDLTPALKETRAGAASGGIRRSGIRIGMSQALVVPQISIALFMAVAAGLFVRSLSNLHSVEVGFNRENLLLFSLNAKQAGYKDAALARFYDDLAQRFRAIPGVRSASLSNLPLVGNYWSSMGVTIPGAPKTAGKKSDTAVVDIDASFLATMQIPVLLGRGIEERDIVNPKVAVVSEKFANTYFENENPIGRQIGFGGETKPADIEIIGVARTTRYNSLTEDPPPVVYMPYTRDLPGLRQVFFELRTAGDPLTLVNTVRQIVHQASAGVPVSNVKTQAAQIDQTISQERTFAELCTCFAILALTIACVGLYGTMAYAVARRTHEIGIRMALGAERRKILRMILREVLALAAVGLGIGLAAAWGTTHFVASILFGIKPNDPVAISISVAVLIVAAILASYAPASRASRIDPMVALRHE